MHHIILAYSKIQLDDKLDLKEKKDFLKLILDNNLLQEQYILEDEIRKEIQCQKDKAKKKSKINQENDIKIDRKFSFDSIEGRWHAYLEKIEGDSDLLVMLTTNEIDDGKCQSILEEISKTEGIDKNRPDLQKYNIKIKETLFFKILDQGSVLLLLLVLAIIIYMLTQGDLI